MKREILAGLLLLALIGLSLWNVEKIGQWTEEIRAELEQCQSDILAGDFDSQRVRNSISNSINPIPMELLFEISSALISDLIWRAFSNGAENLWNYVTESFD